MVGSFRFHIEEASAYYLRGWVVGDSRLEKSTRIHVFSNDEKLIDIVPQVDRPDVLAKHGGFLRCGFEISFFYSENHESLVNFLSFSVGDDESDLIAISTPIERVVAKGNVAVGLFRRPSGVYSFDSSRLDLGGVDATRVFCNGEDVSENLGSACDGFLDLPCDEEPFSMAISTGERCFLFDGRYLRSPPILDAFVFAIDLVRDGCIAGYFRPLAVESRDPAKFFILNEGGRRYDIESDCDVSYLMAPNNLEAHRRFGFVIDCSRLDLGKYKLFTVGGRLIDSFEFEVTR
jgi:hypothetical protein